MEKMGEKSTYNTEIEITTKDLLTELKKYIVYNVTQELTRDTKKYALFIAAIVCITVTITLFNAWRVDLHKAKDYERAVKPSYTNILEDATQYDFMCELFKVSGINVDNISKKYITKMGEEYFGEVNYDSAVTVDCFVNMCSTFANFSEKEKETFSASIFAENFGDPLTGDDLNKGINIFLDNVYSDSYTGVITHPFKNYERITYIENKDKIEPSDIASVYYYVEATGHAYKAENVVYTEEELQTLRNSLQNKTEEFHAIAPEYTSNFNPQIRANITYQNNTLIIQSNPSWIIKKENFASYISESKDLLINLHREGYLKYNMTDAEKAKAIYIWVTGNIDAVKGNAATIFHTFVLDDPHTGYNAFYTRRAVCYGYVGVYNTLLHYEGIEAESKLCFLDITGKKDKNTASPNHIYSVIHLESGDVYADPMNGSPLGRKSLLYYDFEGWENIDM